MLTFHFTVALLAGFASATAVKRAAPGERTPVQVCEECKLTDYPVDGIAGYATQNGGTTGGAGGATTT